MTQHETIILSSTAPTRITPVGIHSGMDITIQNVNNSGYVYIGGEGVSASSYGYRLSPNQAFSIELPGENALYLIAEINEMQAAVLKTNLESQG